MPYQVLYRSTKIDAFRSAGTHKLKKAAMNKAKRLRKMSATSQARVIKI